MANYLPRQLAVKLSLCDSLSSCLLHNVLENENYHRKDNVCLQLHGQGYRQQKTLPLCHALPKGSSILFRFRKTKILDRIIQSKIIPVQVQTFWAWTRIGIFSRNIGPMSRQLKEYHIFTSQNTFLSMISRLAIFQCHLTINLQCDLKCKCILESQKQFLFVINV